MLTINYMPVMGQVQRQWQLHLAADWVRYDHGRTLWEIGNESGGTGSQLSN
jgi:hypothetical protein